MPFTVVPDFVSRMATLYKVGKSHITSSTLRTVFGIPSILIVYYVAKLAFRLLSSPLRRLQGPTGGRLFSGNMLQITGGKSYETLRRWYQQYGPVFAIRAFLGVGTIQFATCLSVILTYLIGNTSGGRLGVSMCDYRPRCNRICARKSPEVLQARSCALVSFSPSGTR